MIARTDVSGVAILRLAHGKASALDLELAAALEQALADCADVPAVVLTGTGSIFSAGVDLKRLVDQSFEYASAFLVALDALLERLFFYPRPIVAAVNGHAIAGGCILAAACDHRFMASGDARIGVPELLVGVPFPTLALTVMRHVTAPSALQRLIYSGATLLPDEAVTAGLIDEVVDPAELESRAVDQAKRFAAIPAESFRIVKATLRQPARDAVDTHRARVDAEVRAVWTSESGRETIRGYIERTFGKRRS